jgi:hypothetical protein
MRGTFLYVFRREDRDTLLRHGIPLLKSDEARNVYVFYKDDRHTFLLDGIEYVLTDTLSF